MKNYRKKVERKQKKRLNKAISENLNTLLDGLKVSETKPKADQSVPAGHIASLMKGVTIGISGGVPSTAKHTE